MPFSVCTTFLLAIQNDWKTLLPACAPACLRALLLCAATIGYYVCAEHDSTVLDSDFGPNSKFVNKQPVAAPTAVLSEFLPSTCAAAGV